MRDHVSIRQQRLATLFRSISDTIRVEDAMKSLDVDRTHAAKLLAGWHRQGAIRRIAHGLYVPVQPSALGQTQVLENPWILVPELYGPGYVGGWSALEHWELTEQIFRPICVLTNKRTSYGEKEHQGVNFFIKHIPEKHLFGTKRIWCDSIRVQISDPCKTVLDIIHDPPLGAGLQHMMDCLYEFKKIYGKQSDFDRLLEYAIQINNGALFKKLGFLAEKLEFNAPVAEECAKRLTKGYAYLDKNAQDNRLITKWRLWVPKGNIV